MNVSFEKYWRERGKEPFSPIQEKVFSNPAYLDFSKNLLIISPTSSGKSLIIEYFVSYFLSKGKKVIYLSPFKSIIEEKSRDFSFMCDFFKKKIDIATHELSRNDSKILKGKYDLLLTIYEKMGYFLQKKPDFLKEVSLLVLDELSIVEDKTRGPYIDILISYAKKNTKILAISSFISFPQRFADYLGAELLTSDERPTPIRIGYIKNGIFYWKEKESGDYEKEVLLDDDIPHEEEFFFLLEKFWKEDGAIVFFPTRKSAKEAFLYIGERLPIVHNDIKIENLPKTLFSENIEEYILRSIGYHSRDLTYEERQFIEKLVQKGKIKLLFATTTLALGVNLPFRNVVFPQRFSIPFSLFNNMIGRAARGIRYPYGRAIFLAREDMDIKNSPSYLVNFQDKSLAYTFFLRKEVFNVKEEELYLKYEVDKTRDDPFFFLKKEGLIEIDKGRSSPTVFGKLVASTGIDIGSFVDIKMIINIPFETSMERLIYLFTDVYTLKRFYLDPMSYKELYFLLPDAQEVLGLSFTHIPGDEELDRIRKTFIMLDFLEGKPLIEIEKRYGVSAGILLEFFDRFLWIVEVAVKILGHISEDNNIKNLLDNIISLSRKREEAKDYKLYIDYKRPDEVFFLGKTIKLTYKQFELLTLLSMSPGKVIPYDEIMARLWKDDYEVSPKQVSYHKGEICKKLGQNIIKSVKKRGLYLDLTPDEVYCVKR